MSILLGALGVGALAWLVLCREANRVQARPAPGDALREGTACATVRVLVKARIRLVAAEQKPVAGAQVVLAPSLAFMRSDEDIETIRRTIEFDVTQGEGASKFAIGRTDEHGAADVEYRSLTDVDDALFGGGGGGRSDGFPFGTFLRIDSDAFGTVFRDLDRPQRVDYRVREGSGKYKRVAQAEFVIRVDEQGDGEASGAVRGQGRRDAIDAAEVERRAREAGGAK